MVGRLLGDARQRVHQRVVGHGRILRDALAKAIELAERIAQNAPMTNYALMHALPRIAEQTADHGYLMEALMSSVVQSAPEAKARVRAFLDGTGPKVKPDGIKAN